MNDLITYFSNKKELIYSYAILAAALFVLFIVSVVVKIFSERREKRRKELVFRAGEESDAEGYGFDVVSKDGEFYAVLLHGDKAVIKSSAYNSVAGVKSALKSLKSNILSDNFTIRAQKEGFTIRLYSSVKLIYESDLFGTRSEAEEEISKIKKAAKIAAVQKKGAE